MAYGVSFPCVSPLGKIFLYLFALLLSGALAAPQAWHLIHFLPPDLFHGLAGQVQGMPFHRYLSRSLQVSAIILLFPLLRSLRIRSLGEFGLIRNPRPWKDLGTGSASGLLCMALLLPILLLSGAFVANTGWFSGLLRALPGIVATAVVVSVLEEFLFRGVLLGFLRRVTIPSVAVTVSAIIFAAVHFLNLPHGSSAPLPVHWWSGLAALAAAGAAMPSLPMLVLAFMTLLTAGLILGWLTLRTGSLHAAIGLHAIFILGQQLFNKAASFRLVPPDALLPFIGPAQCSGAVPVGLLPLAALLLAGFLALVLLRKRPMPPESDWR
jgi:membrane protease YdiL (CAAX protease family)